MTHSDVHSFIQHLVCVSCARPGVITYWAARKKQTQALCFWQYQLAEEEFLWCPVEGILMEMKADFLGTRRMVEELTKGVKDEKF